jgi:hypothetical protein
MSPEIIITNDINKAATESIYKHISTSTELRVNTSHSKKYEILEFNIYNPSPPEIILEKINIWPKINPKLFNPLMI